MYNDYSELYHYGVKGMKWGIRRYQNKDGTLNAAGKRKYGVNSVDEWKQKKKQIKRDNKQVIGEARSKYKLTKHKMEASYERDMNARRANLHRQMFGTSAFYKESTHFKDQYSKQLNDARNYVDKKMSSKHGQAYSTWQSDRETKKLITSGVTFVASLGVVGASLYKLNKQQP